MSAQIDRIGASQPYASELHVAPRTISWSASTASTASKTSQSFTFSAKSKTGLLPNGSEDAEPTEKCKGLMCRLRKAGNFVKKTVQNWGLVKHVAGKVKDLYHKLTDK